jgi:hypothetical protein
VHIPWTYDLEEASDLVRLSYIVAVGTIRVDLFDMTPTVQHLMSIDVTVQPRSTFTKQLSSCAAMIGRLRPRTPSVSIAPTARTWEACSGSQWASSVARSAYYSDG